MQVLSTFGGFILYKLTPELAGEYSDQICAALDQIQLVEPHTKQQILATSKGDRIFFAKWQHSLIALDQNKQFAAILIAYERKSEKNDQYPNNSIYLSDFAVAPIYQKRGLGKFLIKSWLDLCSKKGFLELNGDLRFSVQTNSASWNRHVQELYESFGFAKIATKTYQNRIDNVYVLESNP